MTAAKSPRGVCPVCGHDISIRLDGTLRTHGATAERLAAGSNFCRGSWTKVAEPRVSTTKQSPRAECCACGGKYQLRADGRIRNHGPAWEPRCSGSGQRPGGAR